MSVFADGSVEVNQTLTPYQNMTLVTLPLLSTQVGGVLALDKNYSALSYELSGDNITIYTLGTNWVSLSYDTTALTTEQGTLWTLSFNSPFNTTVTLPSQSTPLSLSAAPVSATTTGSKPTFVLSPGSWEISYGLPTTTTSSNTGANSTSSGNLGQGLGAMLPTLGIVAAVLVVVGVGVAFVARKKMGRAASPGG